MTMSIGHGCGSGGGYPGRMNVDQAERRLTIAVICPRYPLPMTRADQMTVAHLLVFLSARGHSTDLFSVYDGSLPLAEQRQWVAAQCRNVFVFGQPWWRKVIGAGIALLRGVPLQIGWFSNASLERLVRSWVAEQRYDVVYSYTLRSAEPVRALGRGTGVREPAAEDGRPVTYLAMQVSQSLNTRRLARHAPTWPERLLYQLESRLISAYEARVWRGFSRTALIGDADVSEVRRVCAAQGLSAIDNYILSPHGVDTDRFRPRDEPVDPYGLIFSGVMASNTNVSAVLWFVEKIWPEVRAEFPQARFTIVGRMPRRSVIALGKRPGIMVTGEVPDPADYIARAAVCVNPMQAGAGMQNKLLEYLSMGKAVVATSVANEGIRARPDKEILIADNVSEFRAAIVTLLRDPIRRGKIGQAARAYVQREWSWERHFLQLETDMLRQCLRTDGPSANLTSEPDGENGN